MYVIYVHMYIYTYTVRETNNVCKVWSLSASRSHIIPSQLAFVAPHA